MRKLDLKPGLDIVRLNNKEWTIVDENNKSIGIMKESSNIKAFPKTNSIIFNNQAETDSTKYQLELRNCSMGCYNEGDQRNDFCLVTIDFGEYPMVQLLQTADRMIVFKITKEGFILIRESACDKKEIMFKVHKDSNENVEAKHYIIKGTEPAVFKTRYSQRNLKSMYPEVEYTSYNERLGFETLQKLPMGIDSAINSNSIGKSIFKKTREQLNALLPFKEDIIVSLLRNREVPQELTILVPELKQKAKVKRK